MIITFFYFIVTTTRYALKIIQESAHWRASFLQALIVHCYSSSVLRDGPLENFMGGGGGQAKYQKIFAQGKIKWKKIYARQLTLKNIHATAKKKFIQGIW